MTSKPDSGVWLSSEMSGSPRLRNSASMSTHGENARSHTRSSSRLIKS